MVYSLIVHLCVLFASAPPAFADSLQKDDLASPKPGTPQSLQIHPAVQMEFCWIPAGIFEMGPSRSDTLHEDNELPVHTVTFAEGFWMGVYEVTQLEWKAVMGNNPSKFTEWEDLPAEQVSWNDVQKFLAKLNEHAGEDLYRLPSEAEWEYACRAGTNTLYWTGDCISTIQANCDGSYPLPGCEKGDYWGKTLPVHRFPPNPWGLRGMHGNVWEWCEDIWHPNYEGAPADGSAWTEGKSVSRVMRGGSWHSVGKDVRSSNRHLTAAVRRHSSLGLRIVRHPELRNVETSKGRKGD